MDAILMQQFDGNKLDKFQRKNELEEKYNLESIYLYIYTFILKRFCILYTIGYEVAVYNGSIQNLEFKNRLIGQLKNINTIRRGPITINQLWEYRVNHQAYIQYMGDQN